MTRYDPSRSVTADVNADAISRMRVANYVNPDKASTVSEITRRLTEQRSSGLYGSNTDQHAYKYWNFLPRPYNFATLHLLFSTRLAS